MSAAESGTGTQRLVIDHDLTIYNALDTKPRLIDALAGCNELELDLSQVGEIDTAGIQLLILLKREANRVGKAIHVIAHSACVREVLNFYNLAAYFGDPLHIPASEPV